MKKLYYIKCRYAGETWTCDVTDSILEANKLLKEHQEER